MSATFRECAKYVKAQPMKMKMPPMIIVSRQLNTLIRRLAIGPEWTKTRLINLEIIIIINTKLSPHIYIHYFICLYIEYFELSINIMSSETQQCNVRDPHPVQEASIEEEGQEAGPQYSPGPPPVHIRKPPANYHGLFSSVVCVFLLWSHLLHQRAVGQKVEGDNVSKDRKHAYSSQPYVIKVPKN
uniref:Uncharacterized protein n=1 Tax=Magallana gigas TaxID=29159 RepID=K1R7Z2_MAGGI